jgi:hypothetical protein
MPGPLIYQQPAEHSIVMRRLAAPDNGGRAGADYSSYLLFHPSARERTWADFFRAGLAAKAPASLTASLRLLLSVITFVIWQLLSYKTRNLSKCI